MKSNYKWLIDEISQYKIKLYLAGFVASISALLALVPLICIFELSLAYIEQGSLDIEYLKSLGIIAAISVLLRFSLYLLAMYLSHTAAYGLHYDLRMKLSRHLALLPLGFFSLNQSGELKKNMGEDVEIIELFIGHYFPDLVAAISLPIFAMLYLFSIDIYLTLTIVSPFILSYIAYVMMNKVYAKNIQEYHNNLSKMNSVIVEYINGMSVIKAFNHSRFYKHFKKTLDTHLDIADKWTNEGRKGAALFKLSLDLAILLIIIVGGILYSKAIISLAVFIIFLLFSVILLEPINRIIMISSYLTRIFEGITRIRALLDVKPLNESTKEVALKSFDISFKNVKFSYETKEVLHGINLNLPKDTQTYLIGASGSGKSTIASLLARFWDVDSGDITIGGKNIKDISTETLMDNISFVFQDVFLLDDSVMENIRVGNKKATDEEVIQAAKDAYAHDFIQNLKDGYNTNIGEDGAWLSGGEKQRISIARMLLKDSPILILDEATASTDPENELNIYKVFKKLTKDKTVLAITHKLNRLKADDRVALVEDGKIAFEGLYKDLKDTNVKSS